MPKLAICLQLCPKDVWLGLRLVKLICSIEPERRHDIEFIVSARRDTNEPAINEIITVAKTKFAIVRVIKGKRFGTGWPQGCNDLWQETMMRVSMMHETRQILSDGVLTFEADCVPLRADWLDWLAYEWARAKASHKFCVGHAHKWPLEDAPERAGEPGHINGNAIFHVDITSNYPALHGSDSKTGWDCFHSSLLLRLGMDTPMIFQKYRIQSTTRQEIEAIRKDGKIPALFHGIKGESALEAVESMVADGTIFTRKDDDKRGAIVLAHSGGGLFSLINKVIVSAWEYNGEIHVDWSQNCVYGEPGKNAWDELFAPTKPPVGPFEVVKNYPAYWITFRFAGELYKPVPKIAGWREKCKAIWDKLKVHPEIQATADEFVTKKLGGSIRFIGVMVRANVHGAEQPTKRNQELIEYGEAIRRHSKGDEPIFLMTSDEQTLEWFKTQFLNRVVSYPLTKRVKTRDSEELHTSGQSGIEDAKVCLTEILIMSAARLMIHPVSNMATAALYINPDLISVYLP